MRRYRNKFEFVSDVLFLGMLVVFIAVWLPVSELALDMGESLRYAIAAGAALPLWFAARWLTRRFGVEDE